MRPAARRGVFHQNLVRPLNGYFIAFHVYLFELRWAFQDIHFGDRLLPSMG